MESNVYSIAQIFKEKLFVIPDYQRGYAWERQHCEELMEDIELLPDNKEHYTGTLVLYKSPDTSEVYDVKGGSYQTYDVVDGQQRLTTLTILLNTLHKALLALDAEQMKELADGIEIMYLHTPKEVTRDPLYKLTLNQDSRAYFIGNILSAQTDLQGALILSHQRLSTAHSFFKEYFAQQQTKLDSAYSDWLRQIHRKVTQRLKLSVYQVNSMADVGVIFEVMNNRGKSLSELEKVKNYLLYLTSKLDLDTSSIKGLTGQINAVWKTIFETLMAAGLTGESEDQLLRSNWLMAYDYTRKNWKGSKSVKAHFDLRKFQGKHLELYQAIRQYVAILQNCALAFADIEAPNRSEAFHSVTNPDLRRQIKYWSIKLKRLNTLASFRPLLMACRLKFHGDEAHYEQLAHLFELFAFRVYSRIEKQRADSGQASLYKAAFELFHGQNGFGEAVEEVKRTLAWYSNDDTFRKSLMLDDEDPENRYAWSALKYFLYEYEEHLAGNQPVRKSWEEFSQTDAKDSIEHILPQTPEDGYWRDRFDRQGFKQYLHNLGNLCLTYNNSSYRNKQFPLKKGEAGSPIKCYANSALFQERELVLVPEWTVEAIRERRKRLVNWALTRWYVEGLTEVVDEPIEEETEEITD